MRRYIAIFAAVFALASCDKSELPGGNPDYETVTVRVTADMEFDFSAEVTGKAGLESIDYPDIWCFAYDRAKEGGSKILDGYPVIQTDRVGDTYSFVLPKMEHGSFMFAVISDGVEWTNAGAGYNIKLDFTADVPYGKKVWCSDAVLLNTADEGLDNVDVVLRQKHNDFELLLDCRTFPASPEKYMDFVATRLQGVGTEVPFGSFEKVYDENYGREYYSYKFSYLFQGGENSYGIEIFVGTSDKKIYYIYDTVYVSSRNRKLYLTLDYDKFK